MAAATTITTSKPTTKPKRRKHRETTISSSPVHGGALSKDPAHINRKLDKPIIVSPDKTSWCCPSSKPYPTREGLKYEIRFCSADQSPEMDLTTAMNGHHNEPSFPSSFSKFNTVLTAGLLNPMSPPPDPTRQLPTKSSPTLFEMMANEPEIVPRTTQLANSINNANVVLKAPQLSVQDKQALVLQRINDILGNKSPGNLFNDSMSCDVKLTLSSKDGISVSMNVHRQILVGHSRYFAMKLSDRWTKQQRGSVSSPYMVEIADCDDVEVYIETLRLMYCKELRRKLMKEDVNKVLGILKVSAAIGFDAGVLSCLEYLEAAPWSEDEEEKVASLLSELRLEGVGAGEVLKRMSVEVMNGTEENGENEEVLLKLLKVVLDGKEEKARQEMKGLVLKMLRENSSHNYLKKESLYSACDGCLQLLRGHFLRASSGNMVDAAQVARQADNLHWILDILIDRQIAEDFLKIWASQSDMSEVHPKVPAVHRYEVSRVTARLFVGIGKGQMLASKEMRFLLLQTWLVPFYDDFGWMKRASKGLDRHLIEDGLSNTILTLPLAWQQEILLAWFNRFLSSGEDCPNIQRGFEIWWRRAFCKRIGEQERTKPLRIITATIDNS